MHEHQNGTSARDSIRDCEYYPAQLKEYASGKDWRIEYYIQSPIDGKMYRKEIRVTRILKRYTKKAEARRHINEMILSINNKLRDGYNPFYEGEDARLYVSLAEVAEIYLSEKRKELRPDTMRSYSSFCTILLNWVNRQNTKLFCSLFNKSWAVRFMDYVYNERNVSARSYNNYVKQARCLFEWCIEKGYAKANPFSAMKGKRKETKERIIIDPITRERITKYLEKKPFLLVCMLVCHALIRPKEIRNIQIGDIDLNNHTIRISQDIAKNHKTRYAALTPQVEELILKLGIMKYPKSSYLFSDRDTLLPGNDKLYDAKFAKEWNKVRNELHLPKAMQLYSFRDTGIFEMLKAGIDDLTVMQHADHSSLNITTIYANHHDPKLTERVRAKMPKF